MSLPIVIDCDTGVDDAYALLLAVRSARFDLRGVTTVSGNVDVEQVLRNTCVVLDAAEAPADLPVCRGMAQALIEPHHHCPEIHGTNGLGNVERPASRRAVSSVHATQFLVDEARRVERQGDALLTIVALAPLTNVATALRLDPTLAGRLERIVLMGGAARSGGNSTPWSEANIHCDPEAAHIVFSSGVPIVMYPWDVFEQFNFARADARLFAAAQHSWAKLAGELLLSDMQRFKLSAATLGDAGTLCYLLDESSCVTEKVHVTIELQGKHTRGMTVVDLRGEVYEPDQPAGKANVLLIRQTNVPRFRELYKIAMLESHVPKS